MHKRITNHITPVKSSNFYNKLITDKVNNDTEVKLKQKINLEQLKFNDEHPKSGWGRELYHYDLCFEDILKNSGLGKNIVGFLKRRQKLSSQKLAVLDDGIGHAHFITTIKNIFRDQVETTGVCFSNTITAQGDIDNLYIGNAIKLVIKKKQDLIVSFFGSVHYVIPELRKELIEKYAYALKIGGILLIHGPRFSDVKFEEQMIKHLEKNGFKVYIHKERIQIEKKWTTSTFLIQRVK